MSVIFFILTLLAGFTIPAFPLSPGFAPRLGLTPLQWGHNRWVRLVQALVVWVFAGLTMWTGGLGWGWAAVPLALWFTFLALNLYPERIFVALEQPQRSNTGLADHAPVLAAEANGETVAYPLETLVPHHLINDILGDIPALTAW
jgi:hypothetical protein